MTRTRSRRSRRRWNVVDRLLGALGVVMIGAVLAAVAYLLWPEQLTTAAAQLPRIARTVFPSSGDAVPPDPPLSQPPG